MASSSLPIQTITEAEREYQKKFNKLVDGSKILNARSYTVSCAICRTFIKSNNLSSTCLYRTLFILYCLSCSKRICPSGPCAASSCDWCGNDLGSRSKLAQCTKAQCNRKFCKPCVQRIKEGAAEPNERRGTGFCVFCEPDRLLKEDRAVCCAIFRNEIEEAERKKKNAVFEESECIICCNGRPEMSFVPCRHACLCQSCLPQFKGKFQSCPLCSSVYEDIIAIQ